MASAAPQNPNLPLLYKELVPISQQEHGSWRYAMIEAPDNVLVELFEFDAPKSVFNTDG